MLNLMNEKGVSPLQQTKEIAKAIYTVNRHAKTAPEPQHLYFLKKSAIERLLNEKRAKKIGLHFSDHPKFSNQHSTLLIQVDEFYFHVPPTKDDFKHLKHLGGLNHNYRNPQVKMSLSQAKKIIYQYIEWNPTEKKKQKPFTSTYYTPSSLGQLNWKPRKQQAKTRRYK